MITISAKQIEKTFTEIDDEWKKLDPKEFAQKLLVLEKSNRVFSGGKISQEALAKRAIMGLDYYLSRFANEEYDLETVSYLKSKLDGVKTNLVKANSNDIYLKVTRRQLTYLQLALQLDISYPTELMALYNGALLKRGTLTFEDITAFNKVATSRVKAMR